MHHALVLPLCPRLKPSPFSSPVNSLRPPFKTSCLSWGNLVGRGASKESTKSYQDRGLEHSCFYCFPNEDPSMKLPRKNCYVCNELHSLTRKEPPRSKKRSYETPKNSEAHFHILHRPSLPQTGTDSAIPIPTLTRRTQTTDLTFLRQGSHLHRHTPYKQADLGTTDRQKRQCLK